MSTYNLNRHLEETGMRIGFQVVEVLLDIGSGVIKPQRDTNEQQLALSNPIILTTILKQLPAKRSPPLQNCRLVSHFWNDMVLSLPNTKFALKLDPSKKLNPDHDPVPFFDMCSTLDPRLAKRINATCHSYPELPVIHSFAAKFPHVCDKFSGKIQILDISIDYERCLDSIYRALKNSCPNLKQLRITCRTEIDVSLAPVVAGNPILCVPLELKSVLEVFSVSSMKVDIPPLSRLIQLVINASPNLREVTLPLGFYPDLGNSKCLDSLAISLDDARSDDLTRAIQRNSELSRMLGQVGEQLVALTFGYDVEDAKRNMSCDFEELKRTGFQLGERFPKLRNFRNDIIDVFEPNDLIQNLEGMPALKSLEIGKLLKMSTCLDKFLAGICKSRKIFASVTNLRVKELIIPRVLNEMKTAFPNVERLHVDILWAEVFSAMKWGMGTVLQGCSDWGALKHLNLAVPTYPAGNEDFIGELASGGELYKRLKTLEIRSHKRHNMTEEFTEEEMATFETVLIALDELEDVKISNFSFAEECDQRIVAFLVSKHISLFKFRIGV
ncbi:uncharacterized protein LOC118438890 [Folsomia candida]|uniref:F-box domain-containing protein n=1 Tax=Folsomia candida TaxID=158441 RepID=A0A226D9V7_FOLCA|nr:uncharacterized protein LOC118438890 [Folsomia candida]OXA41933.1 hypothetical protein Fcan01_23098 [Folsomia candida]